MRTILSGRRQCGYRKKGGVYLTSEDGRPNGILSLWTSIHPPIPCENKFHRGPVLVDARTVLERKPEALWYVGASADRREKLKADEWAMKRFGMTATMRLRTGNTEGLASVDVAWETLLDTVRFSPKHLEDSIRGLTESKISEIPQINPYFASFIRHTQNFYMHSYAEDLVYAAGATWRMAEATPPRKRSDVIPNLMRVLMVLGLNRDALAMRRRYNA